MNTVSIPLPPSLAGLLAASKSLSLRFDRSFDGYEVTEQGWAYRRAGDGVKEGKGDFLQRFAAAFQGDAEARKYYDNVVWRRSEALKPLEPYPHTATSPLIVGIGRWNPVEVGLTLDRLTGSPYIPGSSVKGLLRAAAQLVNGGELNGDRAFWSGQTISRLFGEQDEHGAVVFYDALPAVWPKLEVDVMTPHHSKYYDGTLAEAADWDEPVPVHFLRVKAGTRFLFWHGVRRPADHRGGDDSALQALLKRALDWLGVGAKTSSGYGWFEALQGGVDVQSTPPVVWQGATLEWLPQTGTLKAVSGNEKAETKDAKILTAIPEVIAKLKRRKTVTATLTVRREGNAYVILTVVAN